MKKKIKNKQEKGITLIALVVTIVVLIILATVSILAVFGDNGIIARAQTAKDTHEKGKADETNTLDDYASYIGNYLDGKGGSSGGGSDTPTNPTAGTTVTKPGTWTSSQVTPIADGNGGTVPLPNGFYYVGGDISTGLVISDKQGDTMSASGVDMGNQFVWIPVESPSVDFSKYTNEDDINERLSELIQSKQYPMAMKMADGNYKGILYRFESVNENTEIRVSFISYTNGNSEREPANLQDNASLVENWTSEQYQKDYNALVNRVKNDKGFWIARYETSVDETGKAQSKKNQNVTTGISWYQMYNYEKTLQNGKTTSNMIWGSQWDQVMIWLKKEKKYKSKK